MRPGMLVMDLGSAPGRLVAGIGGAGGRKGRVLATDILPMGALDNVDFIQGDFTDDAVFRSCSMQLDGRQPDLVCPT
jgi:23S rRNA (uridine2552-2'-O)-methyltransferase